jgi:hypothetical protein
MTGPPRRTWSFSRCAAAPPPAASWEGGPLPWRSADGSRRWGGGRAAAQAHEYLGNKWTEIAKQLNGRTDNQARPHPPWARPAHLAPSLPPLAAHAPASPLPLPPTACPAEIPRLPAPAPPRPPLPPRPRPRPPPDPAASCRPSWARPDPGRTAGDRVSSNGRMEGSPLRGARARG